MKKITLVEWSREDIQQRLAKSKESLSKLREQAISAQLTHFGEWCMEQDLKSIKKYEELLAMDRESYIFLNGKLVDVEMSIVKQW